MKSIILNITQYKETNAIITAVDENGVYSFLARGILNAKARNAALNNPLTIAEIELLDDKKYKYEIMKTSRIIQSPMQLMGNLKEMSIIMLLEEVVRSCLLEEEFNDIYSTLLKGLTNIYSKNKTYESFIHILFKILAIGGFEFSLDHCVNCGRTKDIIGFSLYEGGLICKYCDYDEMIKIDSAGLDKLLKVIKDDTMQFEGLEFSEEEFHEIIKECIIFMEDNYSVTIKNKELF